MSCITESIFTQKSLQFEATNVNMNIIPLDSAIENAKFGVLNITAKQRLPFQEEYDFIYVEDQSGSMDDKCDDGRTKMHHSHHTLKNMIRYIQEHPEIRARISVYSFDDKVYSILERTVVTNENIQELLLKIDKIWPAGGTNMEIALRKVKESIDIIKADTPHSNIVQIFMTDGDVNIGSDNHNILRELVDDTIQNHFIGFGADHNSMLLNAVASGKHSHYRFIDKIENAGIIYGEIFNEIFNRTIKNVHFVVTNGLIYNFKEDTWESTLYIGDIIGETCKSYHIVSSSKESCSIMMTGNKIEDGYNEVIEQFTTANSLSDLTNYKYRQQVLQLLFKCNKYSHNKNNKLNEYKLHKIIGNDLKEELTQLLKEMKAYMLDNCLTNDKFMKNLCDDVFICYKTFQTPYGVMYTNARLSSQGTQRVYSAKYIPEQSFTYPSPISMFGRCNSLSLSQPDEDVEDEDVFAQPNKHVPLLHQLSNFRDTPYATPKATAIMRSFSEGTSTSDIYQLEIEKEDESEEEIEIKRITDTDMSPSEESLYLSDTDPEED